VLSDPGKRVQVALGDDAAVISGTGEVDLIFTTDSFVEGGHFSIAWGSYSEVGYRAMAGALSDVAAMGGRPVAALVSLGLPSAPGSLEIKSLYSGLDKCAVKFGCAIVGGETISTSTDLVITIAVIGEVKKGTALTRSGARTGDCICVTGKLGRNTAALRWLQSSMSSDEMMTRMRQVFFSPCPRIPEAEYLKTFLNVTSMTDLSDGLSTDLGHIITSSGVGAVLFEEALPVSEEAVEVSRLLGDKSLDYVLNGGEDYELLFTIHGELSSAFEQEFDNRFGIPLTAVGKVLDSGFFIEGSNKVRSPLVPGGFDHLRRRGVDADRGD